MSTTVLDPANHQDLILLLYSQTFPYTEHRPPGITVKGLDRTCRTEKVKIEWRSKFWGKDDLTENTILLYIKDSDRDIRDFTKNLRNAVAHCQITDRKGMIYAYCKGLDKNGHYKGRKVFEMLITEQALIGLLTYIRDNKT